MVNLDSKCHTPKYDGKTWEYVINNDPAYVKWMIENIPQFELSNEAYTQYCKSCSNAGIEP